MTIEIDGRQTYLIDKGEGEPLLYLHGFADVHGAVPGLQPFHEQLAQKRRLVAPAHPGCAESTGIADMDTVEDAVIHYVELADALGLREFALAGGCFGGWIAAELAVRYPERVRKLALIGATGLHVPGAPIADLFMLSLSKDGGSHEDVRRLLFADPDLPLARELFPDARAGMEEELLRYKALTFAGRIGWHPPYLYDRKLRGRLRRISCPTLVLWGEHDHMVPLAHAHAYAEGIPNARLHVLSGSGHSPHLEQPEEAARLLMEFLT
ncbi:MAG TPA: alpha/beta fold hydrolase [Chloroflexota bacterium]|nr:alpha/beta fold hydrolase [Chloroflexota bacterium]